MGNISLETMENIMNITVYVFVFLFGITIGSFLNVCILRLPRGESLVKRNSHCMTCGTPINGMTSFPCSAADTQRQVPCLRFKDITQIYAGGITYGSNVRGNFPPLQFL